MWLFFGTTVGDSVQICDTLDAFNVETVRRFNACALEVLVCVTF